MLELAILGLLTDAPLHGYELKKRLGETLGHVWGVSYGSLYPALARLERMGAIEVVDPPATAPGPIPIPAPGPIAGRAAPPPLRRPRAPPSAVPSKKNRASCKGGPREPKDPRRHRRRRELRQQPRPGHRVLPRRPARRHRPRPHARGAGWLPRPRRGVRLRLRRRQHQGR